MQNLSHITTNSVLKYLFYIFWCFWGFRSFFYFSSIPVSLTSQHRHLLYYTGYIGCAQALNTAQIITDYKKWKEHDMIIFKTTLCRIYGNNRYVYYMVILYVGTTMFLFSTTFLVIKLFILTQCFRKKYNLLLIKLYDRHFRIRLLQFH